MEKVLEIKNVSKKFGNIKALDDISFDVEEGEFIFITGASGAGKTTILRLLLNEIVPDSGEILFEGEEITKLPLRKIPGYRRNIGVVFQDFKILPEQNVRENIEIALAVIGLPNKEWKARVDNVLKLVGLDDRSELFPSQLSGGELQRVSLARALVVNPKIVLADEPTGNLDWDTADKIMDLFEKINKEGKTIIMATHHKLIIDKFKERQIELDGGKIRMDSKSKKEKTEKSDKADKKDKKEEDKK